MLQNRWLTTATGTPAGAESSAANEVSAERWRRVEELEERRRDPSDLSRGRRIAGADGESPLGVGRHRGDGARRDQQVAVSEKREDGIGVGASAVRRLEIDAVHVRGHHGGTETGGTSAGR